MPLPTNPPCIGSCPLPPPDIRATLSFTGASARITKLGLYWTLIRSEQANSIPLSASLTTFSGSLMSFFIGLRDVQLRKYSPMGRLDCLERGAAGQSVKMAVMNWGTFKRGDHSR